MNARSETPPRWRAAILDLDGTLVDTQGDFVVALNHTLADLGLRGIDAGFVERTVGKGSEHLIRSTLAEVGADDGHYGAAWERYQHHYRRINGEHSRLYDGVAEGLDRLVSAGLALACVTNKPGAFALELLERKGLRGRFAAVYGGDAFARRKPDPMPLVETCRALGVAPRETLMVGDSSNDVQAARAAGCPVVLVSYGYNHGEPAESAGADAVIDRLDELAVFA
ncbi:phosphoglycolate phosphatase [Caldimonas sp. KR1-144]|uniref:phosphoglycolate phosphatase n=1 Tax=Caldimonas sp. KR1-144 TaxID=3400911 RepID=UPI003C042EB9